MKNLRSSAYAALLLAMVSTGLQAQDAGWGVSADLLTGAGRTNSAAGIKSGLTLSGSYTFETSNGFNVRPGIALNYLIGSGVTGVAPNADAILDTDATGSYTVPGSSIKHTITGVQVFGDLLIPIFDKRADWILGLSVNKYSVKVSGAPAGAYSPIDIDAGARAYDDNGDVVRTGNANGTVSIPSYKMGFRTGFDYKINKNLAIQALLQMTELGRAISMPTQVPTLQPAWVEIGVSYKF